MNPRKPIAIISSQGGTYALGSAQVRRLAALEAALQLDGVPATITDKPPSRNKPCPCRSGKNYKNCCG